jgi:hypothetical protein
MFAMVWLIFLVAARCIKELLFEKISQRKYGKECGI